METIISPFINAINEEPSLILAVIGFLLILMESQFYKYSEIILIWSVVANRESADSDFLRTFSLALISFASAVFAVYNFKKPQYEAFRLTILNISLILFYYFLLQPYFQSKQ